MEYIITVATQQEKISLIPVEYWHHVVITGIGMYNTIRTLRDYNNLDKIINIGFAGAKDLPIGTVHKVASCQPYHINDLDLGGIELSPTGMPCYTATDFITQSDIQGPFLIDMELLAHTVCKCPTVSYKVVSDNMSMDDYDNALQSDYTDEIRKVLQEELQ